MVRSAGRKDRLVLDNSICGTNSNCSVPERQCMPTVRDVTQSFPLRGPRSKQQCLSLDVRSAHKRVVIREEERGLLGFTLDNDIYFYRVAPFGAVFAQHWWGRLGSVILRLLHLLIWVSHCGFLFVDDYLFTQNSQALPLTESMICLFFQLFGIPLSWQKLQIGVEVEWIGWRLHFSAGAVYLSPERRFKLLGMVQCLLKNPRVSQKDLERFIGLALWACNLFPTMRSMLYYFYHDLYSPAASNYSISPDALHTLHEYLSPNLVFIATPPGTAIPLNSSFSQFSTSLCPSFPTCAPFARRISGYGCEFPIWPVPAVSFSKTPCGFCGSSSIGFCTCAHFVL